MQQQQLRTLFGSAPQNQAQLAQYEQVANNNPSNANSQNTFHSALLRAGHPQIVIERYESGTFATNKNSEIIYQRALELAGRTDKVSSLLGTQSGFGQNNAVSGQQLQAIGQAVGARASGANLSISRPALGAGQDGTIKVVVEESFGNRVFKWVKFFFWFGLVTYMSLVLITLVVEAGGVLKKVGGGKDMEARPEMQTTRFTDVHGCDEAKEELQELVEFLKAPDKFNALGGKLPKGILLVGPPGTGKTLLARAVAGEAGVPFFYMSGSEFDEIYVGVGAKRVRELFNNARAKAPAIIFIDELDAIGGKRNERDAAYQKQTLNQLLTELDGFDQSSNVIILAATNFPKALDKALTRPGRFDRNVTVGLPDVRGRIEILKHHMRNMQIGTDIDASVIARQTPGFSGAQLENLVNQAAVHASKNKATKVHMEDMEWAKDKILMGAERRSAVIQHKDKVATAYHEGGHALVAFYTKGADPLYKATILPRGMALGITWQIPEMDKVSQTKTEYLAAIDVCMGGKVAEEIVYGPENVTSGAASDIQKATSLAYSMVTQLGFSDKLGNVDLNNNYQYLSSATRQLVDDEARRLIDEGYARAKRLLMEKRGELDRLANALVEYETLDKGEIERVLRGEKLSESKPKLPSNAPILVPETGLGLPGGLGAPGGSPGPGSGEGGLGVPAPPGGSASRPYPAVRHDGESSCC